MSKIIFTYKGIDSIIHCGMKEKMKNIFHKFMLNNNLEKTEINFLYNEKEINEELTFEQIANTKDKNRKTINILVKEINENFIQDNININNKIENNDNNNKKFAQDIKNNSSNNDIDKNNIDQDINIEKNNSDNNKKIETSTNKDDEMNVNDKDIHTYSFNCGIKINIVANKSNNNPNLKYKLDIINTNDSYGLNDIFEVYISLKDKKQYIVSPNINYNLDIFSLIDNKIIISLEEHKNRISSIRYFMNNKEKESNEYLISADKNKIVILWDITNDYEIKHKIETGYDKIIYSCLLLFPNKDDDNTKSVGDEGFIITSTNSTNDNNTASATKLYSFNNGTLVRYIHNSNNYSVWYLLSWYNTKENKYYIIQLAKKIIINDLFEDEIYAELIQEPEHNHYSGFIYNKDENDYLCTSSQNGFVHIWDLYNQKIFKIINMNKCNLLNIIEWDSKYIIVADSWNKSFKIIDLKNYKVISEIKSQRNENLISIKKIVHPIYGNSLLSASSDKTIELWIM